MPRFSTNFKLGRRGNIDGCVTYLTHIQEQASRTPSQLCGKGQLTRIYLIYSCNPGSIESWLAKPVEHDNAHAEKMGPGLTALLSPLMRAYPVHALLLQAFSLTG